MTVFLEGTQCRARGALRTILRGTPKRTYRTDWRATIWMLLSERRDQLEVNDVLPGRRCVCIPSVQRLRLGWKGFR